MQFDLSTFALEIFNFLVLVWLLQHFLYKPVRDVIDRRQRAIEKSVGDAAALHKEAEQLKAQYAARMSDWEAEKRSLQDKLREEMSAERSRHMEALRKTLAEERKKAEILERRRQEDVLRKNETEALAQAGRFAARLLQRAASPELHSRLIEIFIEDLHALSVECRADIKKAATGAKALVIGAFPLDEEQKGSIAVALAEVAGSAVVCTFSIDPRMICGVRVSLGAHVLRADIADDLSFFTQNWSEAA